MRRSTSRAWVLPEEPVPIRLMSTIWADTAGTHDDLGAPSDVDDWLDAVGVDRQGDAASANDLGDAIRLRDAARRIAAHLTRDTRLTAASAMRDLDEAVQALNSAASRARSARLERSGEIFRVGSGGDIPPVTAALADVARSSIELLGGSETSKVRACDAPGCVLYFVQSHPRREWCSVTCGNRARAARHYEKVRELRGDDQPTA
jgi:predicted RNA-binding Zn ribbon-like protein